MCKDKSRCAHGKCCMDEFQRKEEDIIEFRITKRDGTEVTEVIVRGDTEEEDRNPWWEKSETVKARTIPEQTKRVPQPKNNHQYQVIIPSDSEIENVSDDEYVEESQDLVKIGTRIRVWWEDADGMRWEEGTIISQKTKVSFVISYEFLKKRNEDPEVYENLLGERKVRWETP